MPIFRHRINTLPNFDETFWTTLETTGLRCRRNPPSLTTQVPTTQLTKNLTRKSLVPNPKFQCSWNLESIATNKKSAARNCANIYHLTLIVKTIWKINHWTTCYDLNFLSLSWSENGTSSQSTLLSWKGVVSEPLDLTLTETHLKWDHTPTSGKKFFTKITVRIYLKVKNFNNDNLPFLQLPNVSWIQAVKFRMTTTLRSLRLGTVII